MSRRRGRATRPPERTAAAPVEIEIERLGHRGDGIGLVAGKPVFVPDSLPGERVRARIEDRPEGRRAHVLSVLRPVERADPPCPHYGTCGGCRAQHMPPALYAAWRLDQVRGALAAHDLHDVAITGPIATPPESRRRARLAFRKAGGRLLLGFRARASHRIVDLSSCVILMPDLVHLFAPLRDLLGSLACAESGEIGLTASASGMDVLLSTKEPPGLADREALSAFAQTHDLARMALRTEAGPDIELLAERRPVVVALDGVPVSLPPDAFLQASAVAEAHLQARVVAGIGDAPRVADLFAGCGTFTLPLAQRGAGVLAVEGHAAMTRALLAAARLSAIPGKMSAETRDLFVRPLTPAELDRFDAIVLDPPRAGARAQCEALAASSVARAVMVSCHPASFARDAAILTRGGLRLDCVEVVDAFLWSDQVELVARFVREL